MEKRLEEIISKLEEWQNEGLIKILNWNPITVLTLPKLTSKQAEEFKVEEWIDEYRHKFKGKKPGAMGDRTACIVKMKELFVRRPDLTKDIVMAATDKYIQVESINRYKYLMQADYFISKNVSHTKDGRVSKLEAFCDEVMMNNTEENKFTYDI